MRYLIFLNLIVAQVSFAKAITFTEHDYDECSVYTFTFDTTTTSKEEILNEMKRYHQDWDLNHSSDETKNLLITKKWTDYLKQKKVKYSKMAANCDP